MLEIAKLDQITDPEYGFVKVGIVEATENTLTGHTMWTFLLTYPRFIHSEFMTHHAISKCAASSRAIPVKKMIAQVWNNPVTPYHWGANRAGMQATSQLTGWRKSAGRAAWLLASKSACVAAWFADTLGGHKQWVNRMLEPFLTITVVATATELDNFYTLRDHPDAQPELRRVAVNMKMAQRMVKPRKVNASMGKMALHLPFVTADERVTYPEDSLLKFSAARCARTSYLNHDKKSPTPAGDEALFDKLITSEPEHASPTEHQGFPAGLQGPFYSLRGWMSLRYKRDTDRRLRGYVHQSSSEQG